MMPSKRILITGGFGYLGSRLAQHLHDDGYEVILLVRDNPRHDDVAAWAKQFAIVVADITDKESALAALKKAGKIDAVLHLAAVNEIVCVKDSRLAFEVNCFGTQHLLDAAAATGVRRIIYLSTFHAYGDQGAKATISEQTIPNPTHPYGLTHFVAEQMCRAAAKQHSMELAIIRLSNGIGRPAIPSIDRWTLLLLDLCRQAHEKGSIALNTPGYQLRDFVSIDDLHQAVALLLAADPAAIKDPVFNVGSGRSVMVRELAKAVQQAYEQQYRKVLPLHIPEGKNPDSGAKLDYKIEKIMGLGFRPTTDLLEEARKTLAFCEVFR